MANSISLENRVVENIRHDLMEMREGENDNVTLEQKIKNDAHKLEDRKSVV